MTKIATFSRRAATMTALALLSTGMFISGVGVSEAQALTKVKAAETPGVPAAFLGFGVAKGFFAEEGLDLEVTTLPGGAQQVTAALSGDVQFTGGDVVAFTTFRSRNVPVKIVRPGSGGGSDITSDYVAIITGPNTGITEPEDLVGKQIGVNELNNIGAIMATVALEKHGVKPDDNKWAEIPLPNVMAAIETGQIDAGYALEPFITMAEQRGFKPVIFHAAEYGANTQIGLSLTTEAYYASNPAQVEAFQRAHKKTGAYVMAHPDEFRAHLVTIGALSAEVAPKMRIPNYMPEVNRASVEAQVNDMLRLGVIKKKPDLEAFYIPNS